MEAVSQKSPRLAGDLYGEACGEYQTILCSKENASEKFWTLEKRIAKDKHNPGVIIDMRRSQMRNDILYLLQYGVITLGDLGDFSQELQESMAWCMENFEKG